MADRATTLIRNDGAPVPLRNPDRSCLFVLLESRYSQQGRQMIQELRARNRKLEVRTLDPFSPESELADSVKVSAACDATVVAAWVTAGAYRGNIALPGNLAEFVNALTAGPSPVVLVSFGNPYLLRSFPKVAAYMAMFSTVPISETSAVKALFGEIGITGHMPVSIPGFAKAGDGIQIPIRAK